VELAGERAPPMRPGDAATIVRAPARPDWRWLLVSVVKNQFLPHALTQFSERAVRWIPWGRSPMVILAMYL